jgi:hypothetical protein
MYLRIDSVIPELFFAKVFLPGFHNDLCKNKADLNFERRKRKTSSPAQNRTGIKSLGNFYSIR